ncbi:DinB family protein [Aequorivita sp. SDUM287046]|uniref:DinB family protein n=1 Tax=Aequorivita aurantiaca TaxID=3053356 RepID=A0ABT8DGF7_9FLAO|nr:DinB family protein [Aequorivita aurantiaca]MDN3723804.1 DinB family protein [Aequorivita aurantiaca]
MNETERIQTLFTDLYHGHPWLDVTLQDTLSRITATQANQRPISDGNTIWEIVNHLIAWRQNVLKRVQGEVLQTPSNNYIKRIEDDSKEAWQQTLEALETTQKEWLYFLNTFNEADFVKEYSVNKLTYYQHIHGIIQHDAYHLGQIVLLAKMV